MLLARPSRPGTETVNDLDCYLANFWRSVIHAPEALADFADNPVNEADLHARHVWLLSQVDFRERMLTDPDFYDPKIAGWWVWGVSTWIRGTGGWCLNQNGDRRPTRAMPKIGRQGVNSPRIQDAGIQKSMIDLARRFKDVRVLCGDWSRAVGPGTIGNEQTAILLDPPYFDDLSDGLYAHGSSNVSARVREWAIENGPNPNLRIALCGYEGEHAMPDDWEKVEWKATGGFGCQRKDGSNQNQERERIWFSQACLKVTDNLFAEYDEGDE